MPPIHRPHVGGSAALGFPSTPEQALVRPGEIRPPATEVTAPAPLLACKADWRHLPGGVRCMAVVSDEPILAVGLVEKRPAASAAERLLLGRRLPGVDMAKIADPQPRSKSTGSNAPVLCGPNGGEFNSASADGAKADLSIRVTAWKGRVAWDRRKCT
jgi:hypothetical protein